MGEAERVPLVATTTSRFSIFDNGPWRENEDGKQGSRIKLGSYSREIPYFLDRTFIIQHISFLFLLFFFFAFFFTDT